MVIPVPEVSESKARIQIDGKVFSIRVTPDKILVEVPLDGGLVRVLWY